MSSSLSYSSATSPSYFKRLIPVKKEERVKIILLNILLGLATGVYGILRILKDAKVVGAGGSKLIASVKLLGVLPIMVIAKLIYDQLNKRVGVRKQFYYIVGYFGVFFLVFYFWFMDQADPENCTDDATLWVQFTKMWPWILFYIHAELWGTFVLSICCWAFINRVMNKEQAKRCIITLAIGSALATLMAGVISLPGFISSGNADMLIWVVLIAIGLLLGLYYWLNDRMEKYPVAYQMPAILTLPKKVKSKKLGFVESIKAYLKSENSAYIGLMCLLVVGYAISINLFEGIYKDLLKQQSNLLHATKSAQDVYLQTMSAYQLIYIGIFSLVFTLFIAEFAKTRGWRFCALVVPVLILIGTFLFLMMLYSKETLASLLNCDKNYILQIIVYLGMSVVVCVKSIKYVLFDTTKELAYRPLDEESRLTGKSFVDGVGSRAGKAGGSLIINGLSVYYAIEAYFTGAAKPIKRIALESKGLLGMLIFCFVSPWIWAVYKLNNKKETLEALREKEANEAQKIVALV